MIGHIIGAREFVDGTRRPIYEDAQGQYLDNEGEPFHGVWLGSYELPLIVDGQPGARETSETDVNHPTPEPRPQPPTHHANG